MQNQEKSYLPMGFQVITNNNSMLNSENVELPTFMAKKTVLLHHSGVLSNYSAKLVYLSSPDFKTTRRSNLGITKPFYALAFSDLNSVYKVPIEVYANQVAVIELYSEMKSLEELCLEIKTKARSLFEEHNVKMDYPKLCRFASIYIWSGAKHPALPLIRGVYSDKDIVELAGVEIAPDRLLRLMGEETDLESIKDLSGLPEEWIEEMYGSSSE